MARNEMTRNPFTAPLAGIAGALSDAFLAVAAAVRPGWTAGEAHLAGPGARAAYAELAPIDERLFALELEIARRRNA